MKTEAYILNAFGVNKNGGNPAGVVLNANDYSESRMLSIAKELGFSETVFVMDQNCVITNCVSLPPRVKLTFAGMLLLRHIPLCISLNL